MRLAIADNLPSRLLSSEAELIQSAQGGDREAFAVLVERYWDRLFRWLYNLTHNQHTAEDLTQDTFLKALSHLDSFQVGGNFRAWLFRIAHNSCINHAKACRTRLPLPETLPDDDEGPLEQVQSREAMQALARAVGRLPAEFRAAFLLRVEEGLSFRQIAEVLGLTEETARWRVFKARQKLVHVLASQLDGEDDKVTR
jgi:RNA polymerase sigma-70 factor (ECF subfamily)